jgi:hypothetical protein
MSMAGFGYPKCSCFWVHGKELAKTVRAIGCAGGTNRGICYCGAQNWLSRSVNGLNRKVNGLTKNANGPTKKVNGLKD